MKNNGSLTNGIQAEAYRKYRNQKGKDREIGIGYEKIIIKGSVYMDRCDYDALIFWGNYFWSTELTEFRKAANGVREKSGRLLYG